MKPSEQALARFVSRDRYRDGLRQVFSVEHEGAAWAVATNGWVALMLRGYACAPNTAAPDTRPLFDAGSGAAIPVDLAALGAFLGVPVEPVTCAKCVDGLIDCAQCSGSGKDSCVCDCGHEHEADCRKSDGTGDVHCPDCEKPATIDPVMIFGTLFDRYVVARALADAELREGVAMWHTERPLHPHAIVGDGWRLVIAGVRDEGESQTAPAFNTAATAGAEVTR